MLRRLACPSLHCTFWPICNTVSRDGVRGPEGKHDLHYSLLILFFPCWSPCRSTSVCGLAWLGDLHGCVEACLDSYWLRCKSSSELIEMDNSLKCCTDTAALTIANVVPSQSVRVTPPRPYQGDLAPRVRCLS